MKKHSIILLILLFVVTLSGCGSAKNVTTTTIILEKKGEVTGAIVEPFDKEYYTEEKLKTMTDTSVADYNIKVAQEKVKLDSLSVKDKIAKVILHYNDSVSYSEFNEVTFFSGTVAEAYEAGYNLDVTLDSTAKGGKTIEQADILKLGDHHIVISDESLNIRTFGTIEYISTGVTLVDKKEAATSKEAGQISYLIFK